MTNEFMTQNISIPKAFLLASMLLFASTLSFAATPKLKITTKNNSEKEIQRKEQIERLAAQYDLKKWIITKDILIEQGVIPHSKPVLTLNVRWLDNDDAALSMLIHEEAHWFLGEHWQSGGRKCVFRTMQMFRGLPIGAPDGSMDEMDNYVHVIVNWLEWQGLEEYVGTERARAVIDMKAADHYKAIYKLVIANREKIGEVLQRYRLQNR